MAGALFESGKTRAWSAVPAWLVAVFLFVLVLQLGWASLRMPPQADISDLPAPPPPAYLRFAGIGDDVFLSKALVLWLQGHDYQPGISLSYRELDYDRLIEWLDTILILDPESQYPLLLASRVYGDVNEPDRQRKMLDFIAARFMDYPAERWRWMAHAVYVARHRLDDNDLALKLARILADNATSDNVPFWARQMHIYILEDMGQLEAARILLGGLIDSGEIKDPNELRFLMKRLRDLEERNR